MDDCYPKGFVGQEISNYTKRLVIATQNSHKTQEIFQMLHDAGISFDEVFDLNELSDYEAPEESGTTFAENSAIKARAAAERFPDDWILADDSGLEVDVLNGAPGVYSARYAGEDASDADNRKKLIQELSQQDQSAPFAGRFCCCLTLIHDGVTLELGSDEKETQLMGTCEGRLITAEQGEGGFGYDPLFVPDGYTESFAQLGDKVKNELSHRGKAMQQLIELLRF